MIRIEKDTCWTGPVREKSPSPAVRGQPARSDVQPSCSVQDFFLGDGLAGLHEGDRRESPGGFLAARSVFPGEKLLSSWVGQRALDSWQKYRVERGWTGPLVLLVRAADFNYWTSRGDCGQEKEAAHVQLPGRAQPAGGSRDSRSTRNEGCFPAGTATRSHTVLDLGRGARTSSASAYSLLEPDGAGGRQGGTGEEPKGQGFRGCNGAGPGTFTD